MTPVAYKAPLVSGLPAEPKTLSRGYVFGAPVKELGWITCLIAGLAVGFIFFFGVTFLGIVCVMVLNATGHTADYTASYRLGGLPAGLLAMVLSLGYLATFWVKRITRGA